MSEDRGLCALWVLRNGSPLFDLHDTEADAARAGVWGEASGDHAVLGVQFPDGHYLRRESWPAYVRADEEERASYARTAARRQAHPPQLVRVLDPFTHQQCTTPAPVPAWVGEKQWPAD